ncbi:MAG TPA: S41 family peptidase [Fimbriimonas sp.]|nr:S41 family peptidase [Fimbriimonas sp.]
MAFIAPLLVLLVQNDDFSKTWQAVSEAITTRYYARETRRSEMNSLLAEYGPKAKAAQTREEFDRIVNAMIHDFKDSHFAFLTDSDQGYYLMDGLARPQSSRAMPEIGAWFVPAADGYTVTMVLEGSEAERAGLRKGDLITLIDGHPFTPVDSLRDKVNRSVTLTVRRGDRTLTPKVSVSDERCLEMFLQASRDSAKVIERNGRKIGYFHLWTQSSPAFQQALDGAVLGKLRDTDAFILDMRDGFGGRPNGYGDAFFRPESWIEYKWNPRSGTKELFGYQRPLVLLINGGSRSAKEVLSYIFKKSKRATLIGQTTAGNVLGTFPIRINDWSYIEIPIEDVITDGKRLEGRGVTPDVAVPSEFDQDGHDMDLQAALDRLANVPAAHS